MTREGLSEGVYCKHLGVNIGILRMTGEVTDRFNGITLFRIGLIWKKQLNTLQNLQYIFSQKKWNAYFTRDSRAYLFYRSLSDRGGMWIVGSQVDAQPDRSVAEDC